MLLDERGVHVGVRERLVLAETLQEGHVGGQPDRLHWARLRFISWSALARSAPRTTSLAIIGS